MTTLYFTEATVGIPQLSQTYGALPALFDWALVQNGWSILHSSGNRRVYKMGAGSERCLQVVHDNSVLSNQGFAAVRGCQTASNVNTLVEPFPTVAQAANSVSSILVSASSGDKPFRLLVGETFVILACATSNSYTTNWDLLFFGDAVPTDPNDNYATCILIRNSTSTSTNTLTNCMAMSSVLGKLRWIRSIDGLVLSTGGAMQGICSNTSLTSVGTVSNTPPARAGYLNRVVREPMALSCTGGASGNSNPMAIAKRAFMPHFWNPIHSDPGGLTAEDFFTDSAYDPASLFTIIPSSSSAWGILEISDTWQTP